MRGAPRVTKTYPGEWLPWAVFLSVAMVYGFERAKNAGWGDGLGFLSEALSGFAWSVHGAGHFLYANLNTLVLRIVPDGDPASLITGVSIVFALVALFFVYRTAFLVTGNTVASLAGMLVLAFSFTFWRQAVSIEVYTTHLAFVAAFFRYIVPCALRDGRFSPDRAGILFCLALLVHIQTILLLPAFAVWVVFSGWRTSGVLRSAFWAVLGFLVLIVPAALKPDITVMSVFASPTFMPDVFAFSSDALVRGAVRSLVYLAYNFHFFLPVALIGAVRLWRRERRLFILYAAVLIPVWGFAFRYTVSDNYVFFLSAYLVVALTAASGFSAIIESCGARRWCPAMVLAGAFLLSPAVYGMVFFAAERTPVLQRAFSRVEYKGGAAYYLWPGMRTIPDPLTLVLQHYPGGELPNGVDPVAWRNLYAYAVQYLELAGELPDTVNR